MDESENRERTCQSIDWYGEGEGKLVEIDGVQMEVKFIARKGRRGRIAIKAPAGATFAPSDCHRCPENARDNR